MEIRGILGSRYRVSLNPK